MTTKNDVTGDLLKSKPASESYRNNYDTIFRKPTVLFDPILMESVTETGKEVLNELQRRMNEDTTRKITNGLVVVPMEVKESDAHTHTPMTTTHKKLTPCKACGSTGKVHDSEDGGNWISCSNIMCMASTMIYYSCGEDCRPRMIEQWESGRNLEFLDDVVDFSK